MEMLIALQRQATTYDYFLVEIDDTLPDVEDNDALYTILTSVWQQHNLTGA